jgi:hypothetical protein
MVCDSQNKAILMQVRHFSTSYFCILILFFAVKVPFSYNVLWAWLTLISSLLWPSYCSFLQLQIEYFFIITVVIIFIVTIMRTKFCMGDLIDRTKLTFWRLALIREVRHHLIDLKVFKDVSCIESVQIVSLRRAFVVKMINLRLQEGVLLEQLNTYVIAQEISCSIE